MLHRHVARLALMFAVLWPASALFAQGEQAAQEDPVTKLAAGKEAELRAREAEGGDEVEDKASQAQTTKGAGEASEAPEPDYLALADAPLFLPRNYLYWGTPVGPKGKRESLIFGLEYALHLPIYSNLRDSVLIGKHWAGAVTLSFEGVLRMLSMDSKPVRMPSYRPNISGQLFYTFHQRLPVIIGLRVNVFHYSNGQEQCTFGSGDSESPDCQARIASEQDPRHSLNRVNGDFSMNGWLGELNVRLNELNEKGVAIGHLTGGVGVSGHIKRGPGAMEPPLLDLYGYLRVEVLAEWKRRMGWAAITARGAYSGYPGSGPDIPGHAGRVEVVLDPYWLTGLGLFARYYGGRDFYNAFFVDNLQQFSAGIAWDGERPLKFERK